MKQYLILLAILCVGSAHAISANPSSAETGQQVTFTTNLSGTITWDFGDGNHGTGTTVGHTYQYSGIYTVTADDGSTTETREYEVRIPEEYVKPEPGSSGSGAGSGSGSGSSGSSGNSGSGTGSGTNSGSGGTTGSSDDAGGAGAQGANDGLGTEGTTDNPITVGKDDAEPAQQSDSKGGLLSGVPESIRPTLWVLIFLVPAAAGFFIFKALRNRQSTQAQTDDEDVGTMEIDEYQSDELPDLDDDLAALINGTDLDEAGPAIDEDEDLLEAEAELAQVPQESPIIDDEAPIVAADQELEEDDFEQGLLVPPLASLGDEDPDDEVPEDDAPKHVDTEPDQGVPEEPEEPEAPEKPEDAGEDEVLELKDEPFVIDESADPFKPQGDMEDEDALLAKLLEAD